MNRHVNSQAANKYKKDQVKRQIKYKISEHKGKQLDVKEIIKNADRPHSEEKEIIRNIVNKELEDQQNNFKRRLEEKKKKNLLSTSDITDIENVKTLMSCTNKSNFDLINNVDEIEENVLDDYPNDSNNNILLEIDNEDFKDVSEEISFTPGELSKGKIRTSKQKQIFNDLQDITEGFLSEFNFYFYEEIFQSVVNEIEKRLKVKQQKSLEISKNYNSQIKEMEFLLSSGKKSFNSP